MFQWAVIGGSVVVCALFVRRLFSSASRVPKVFIRDKANVADKIRKMVSDGPGKLQLISDYDKTLTLPHSLSSFDMLERSGMLSEKYERATKVLAKKYYPIEIDYKRSVEEKMDAMMKWFKEALDLLIEEKLSQARLEEYAKTLVQKVELREGYEEMFALLYENAIPVLVLSAGVGDMIDFVFKDKGLDKYNHKNVHVLANFFQFDEKTNLVSGYKGRMIHVFNKNEVIVKETPHYANISSRGNVILLGDSLGDLSMADGVPHDFVLTIGFLNLKGTDDPLLTAGFVEEYQRRFDVVLMRDNSMSYVLQLLKDICVKPKDA